MRYELHPEAFVDIQSAVDFYDENVAGLGAQFVEQLEADIAKIAEAPKHFFCAYPEIDIRRYPMKRYPYSVFYRIDTTCVMIIAVAHQAREPLQWLDRIGVE